MSEVNLKKKLFGPNHIKIFSVEKMEILLNNKKIAVPYYSMEFLPGLNLREVLNQKIELNLTLITEIITGVMNALKEAHLEKIYHKDIKPENIMISKPKKNQPLQFVKLLDFGVAEMSYLEDNTTNSKGIKGTISYMSPEQIKNMEIGPESDYFSLGAVFYELLTGQKLFLKDDHNSVVQKIISKDKVSLSLVSYKYNNDLCDILKKMLAKKKEERYQNANDLLHDLTELHLT